MKEQKIVVVVSADGEAEIEAQGFSDGACLKETEALENALGKVSNRKRTNHGVGVATGNTVKTSKN